MESLPPKIFTLCFVCDGPRILLGMKKRGFGEGRWNGFGGKVLPGESIQTAAQRELEEEAGITTYSDLAKCGVLDFTFEGDPQPLEVHVFKLDSFDGTPTESEEMRPQWFSSDALPFEHMWPDDKHWFPLFLAGEQFHGSFLLRGHNEILEYDLVKTEYV